MAKRKRKRKTPTRRKKREPLPGWMWMFFGLGIGLAIAYAVYQRPVTSEPVSRAASIVDDERDEPRVKPVREAPPEREPAYDFYEELPRFEVTVPEEDLDVRPERATEAVVKPGIYEIQAGSFNKLEDADRRRAELALLGFESRVQRVSIDEKTYHRVRIGPIESTKQLNTIRARLFSNDIDSTAIRVGG